MNCPKCNSIWLRPEGKWLLDESTQHHTRTFRCGSCGSVFLLRAVFVRSGPSDIDLFNHKNDPPEQPPTATIKSIMTK